MQAMTQIQIEEDPTCPSCGGGIDEGQTNCADCQLEAKRKELLKQELEDRAEERSQYRHLQQVVVEPMGDWYVIDEPTPEEIERRKESRRRDAEIWAKKGYARR